MKLKILVTLLLITSNLFAEVVLKTEKQEVLLGEAFHLMLLAENTRASPDFTPLEKDFTIVGTQTSSSYSYVNGKERSQKEWTLLLEPKHIGTLVIPSIAVGKEKTREMVVEVTASTTHQSKKEVPPPADVAKGVFLSTEVSEPNPYVNQEVIYTVKLYNSLRLFNVQFQAPKVKDALFVSLGDGRSYQEYKEGHLYHVEEQQYAIFPQKSGFLEITPPVFQAFSYESRPQKVDASAKPCKLTVKTIPAQISPQEWLPAKNILLQEEYDKKPTAITEGNTLIRTIRIDATGVPAQWIPIPTMPSSQELRIYTEKPLTNNRFRHHSLIGRATIKVTYLFQKSGNITIPAITLPWFNTQKGKAEIATLPALTLSILPSSEKKGEDLPSQQESLKIAAAPSSVNNTGWWVAAMLAIGWGCSLLFLRNPKRKPFRLRRLRKELKQAALSNQAKLAEEKLIAYASLLWRDTPILHVTAIINLVEDEVLQKELEYFSEVLYGKTPSPFRGRALWQAIEKYTPKKPKKPHPLPPIYPQ